MKYIIEKFSSISEIINELPKRPKNNIMKNENASHSGDEHFTETKSYEEAVKFALDGYEKPLEALKAGSIQAERKGTAPRKCRAVNDIIGYIPNVPAAVIGLPQSMIRSEVEMKKSKVVSILYAPTRCCGTDAKTIEKAGIALLSIINNLEKSGYRVALEVMCQFTHKDGEVCAVAVKVKDWRQPIDLKKIAFPICNASFQRRIGFKWLETTKEITQSGFAWGYGRSYETYNESKEILDKMKLLDDTTFFVNVDVCKDCSYDIDKISEKIGLTQLKRSK